MFQKVIVSVSIPSAFMCWSSILSFLLFHYTFIQFFYKLLVVLFASPRSFTHFTCISPTYACECLHGFYMCLRTHSHVFVFACISVLV